MIYNTFQKGGMPWTVPLCGQITLYRYLKSGASGTFLQRREENIRGGRIDGQMGFTVEKESI